MQPDQISQLIDKYARGSISAEESQILIEWYRSVEDQDVAWPLTQYGEKEELRTKMLARLNTGIGAKSASIISLKIFKVAAAVLVMIGLAIAGYYFSASNREEFYTVTNAGGSVQLVHLPDSSKVWLNAATTLRYNTSFSNRRELELEGEAFFEVTKDQQHPFSIKSGAITTTVLGTSFNVSAYSNDELKTVSVVTGRVKVSDDKQELALLTPSKTLRYDSRTKEVVVVNGDTASIISWIRGKLQFDGESLAEISRSLARWYGYSFVFRNKQLENCRYYLNLDNSITIEEAMNVLKEVAGVQVEINATTKSITINGTSCQ